MLCAQAAYRQSVPIEQRLYADAGDRYGAREREKRELEDAEMRAHPYRPSVNQVSKQILRQSAEYRPIQDRVAQVQRERSPVRSCAVALATQFTFNEHYEHK